MGTIPRLAGGERTQASGQGRQRDGSMGAECGAPLTVTSYTITIRLLMLSPSSELLTTNSLYYYYYRIGRPSYYLPK